MKARSSFHRKDQKFYTSFLLTSHWTHLTFMAIFCWTEKSDIYFVYLGTWLKHYAPATKKNNLKTKQIDYTIGTSGTGSLNKDMRSNTIRTTQERKKGNLQKVIYKYRDQGNRITCYSFWMGNQPKPTLVIQDKRDFLESNGQFIEPKKSAENYQ